MAVVRLRSGESWTHDGPGWSPVSAAGWFDLSRIGRRFDRHFHDCDEYWAVVAGRALVVVGGERTAVGPGDLVATPAGVTHDVEAASDNLVLFFWEDALPVGGVPGHRHLNETDGAGHPIEPWAE